MIDPDLIAVLRKAVTIDGEVRLVKEGKNDGLIPGRSKKCMPVIEGCLDAEAGLFEIVREEITGKKTKKTHWFVKVGVKGLSALIESSTVSEYPDLIKGAAACYQKNLADACTPALRKAQQEAFEAESVQWQEAVEMISTRLNYLEGERNTIDAAIQGTLEFQNRLEKIRPQPPAEWDSAEASQDRPLPQPEKSSRLLPPADLDQAESAYEYQRSLCEGLVQAWEYASHPDAIEELEYCLLNAGLEPANAVGEIVPFNGIDHETEDNVSEGEPVEIVRPAYCLPLEQFGNNEKGEVYQLCKAVVRAANSKETERSVVASEESKPH